MQQIFSNKTASDHQTPALDFNTLVTLTNGMMAGSLPAFTQILDQANINLGILEGRITIILPDRRGVALEEVALAQHFTEFFTKNDLSSPIFSLRFLTSRVLRLRLYWIRKSGYAEDLPAYHIKSGMYDEYALKLTTAELKTAVDVAWRKDGLVGPDARGKYFGGVCNNMRKQKLGEIPLTEDPDDAIPELSLRPSTSIDQQTE